MKWYIIYLVWWFDVVIFM